MRLCRFQWFQAPSPEISNHWSRLSLGTQPYSLRLPTAHDLMQWSHVLVRFSPAVSKILHQQTPSTKIGDSLAYIVHPNYLNWWRFTTSNWFSTWKTHFLLIGTNFWLMKCNLGCLSLYSRTISSTNPSGTLATISHLGGMQKGK